MWHLCGPGSWRFLLASPQDVADARAVLEGAQSGVADPHVLLHAQRLSASVLHPDTHEEIPLPFRMAAHVPANALLLTAMLSSRTVLGTAVAQFANQSFNALQFYANRNASAGSDAVPPTVVFASYVGAVTSSVAVAAGLRGAFLKAEARAGLSPARARLLTLGSAAVPFLGAASGKPLQIGLMRQDEVVRGVVVTDADGRGQGTSRVAGRRAVGLTIATRTLYLAPMLWMPYAQALLERSIPLLQRNKTAATVSFVLHSGVNSAVVTPACIALFDQRAALDAEDLEEEFQGRGLRTLYFNKGL